MGPTAGLDAVERKVSARNQAPIPGLSSSVPRHCSPFSDRRISMKSFQAVHYFSLLSSTGKNLYHNTLCLASSIRFLLAYLPSFERRNVGL
jgi:hypothetical protein